VSSGRSEPRVHPCRPGYQRRIPHLEETAICANCGCGVAEDKHGDERNTTWSEIEAAADANGMSPEQTVANMQQMAQQRS
jgi:hypothetical protein